MFVQINDVLDAFDQADRVVFEFNLAGLDLREIENIIDQAEQGITASF